MTWLTVTEYLCHKWPRIYSVCRNNNPVLSSFMTYHRVCDKIYTMGTTCGVGIAYPSGASEFAPCLHLSYWCSCCWCCQITRVHVFRSVVWCPLLFPRKNDVQFISNPICLWGLMFYLFYHVFIYVYWCPTRFHFRWCSFRLTRRESHVEQELLTLLEHLRSPPLFS